MAKLTLLSNILFLAWTFNIASLSLASGRLTVTCLSNLPGRSKAGSSTSGLLVAAIMMIPSFSPKPSISVNNWLRVCSLSSCPPPRPVPLWRPTASISSMNIRHGALRFASLNISRTRLAPTPTNSSTKSEPLIKKNGTFASPAIALASNVLPVPGGPTSKTPLGILAPSFSNFLGFFKKSISSATSSFSSFNPATSLKLFLSFSLLKRALLRPKSIELLLELASFINKKYMTITNNTKGRTLTKI